MHPWGVRHRPHVFALGPLHSRRQVEFGDRLRRVCDQAVLIRCIHPGVRHYLRSVKRSHLSLEHRQHLVDRLVGDNALFNK
jgi:hypothetical protein